MTKNILKSIVLIAILAFTTNMSAQKIASVNTDTILSLMPELATIQTQIKAIQAQKQQQLQASSAEIQKKYQEYLTAKKGTTTSAQELELMEQSITQGQEALKKQEQAMYASMQEQQTKLMEPVVKKVKLAIDIVAKNNGYSYVAAKGMFLTMPSNADITNKVINYLKL